MTRRCAIGLLALAAACTGGLDNRPFEPGSGPSGLRGHLEGEIDPLRAYVTVFATELTAGVDASGDFELPGALQAGAIDLAGSTGAGRAFRRPVTLYSDRVSNLEFPTDLGVTIRGQVALGRSSTIAPIVSVEGLPDQAVRVEADPHSGAFEIASLPPGHTRLLVEHRGDPHQRIDLDLAAGAVSTPTIHLAPPTGRSTCQPCGVPSDCASNACFGGRFAGGIFELVCLPPCAHDLSCAAGFKCIATPHSPTGQLCVPVGATCGAILDLSAKQPCFEDRSCGLSGAPDALCRNSSCTYGCASGADCVDGTSCAPDPSGGPAFCQ